MARIRTVKPEFWRHPVYARLPDDFQLLALSLLTMADDEGYFRAEPALIRGDVQPFREDLGRISGGLQELSNQGWIEVKKHPKQGNIGRILNFEKHQRVHHPTPSKLKSYFFPEEFPNHSGEIPPGTGNMIKVKVKSFRGGGSSNGSKAPPLKLNQNDFDERDWRKVGEAKRAIAKRLQASVGGGNSFTNAEYWAAVSDESGVTLPRVMKLQKQNGGG
jgi:hypothetical protein